MGVFDFWRSRQPVEVKAAPSLPAPAQPSGDAHALLAALFPLISQNTGKLHIDVTPQTAMRSAAVRRAVSVLAHAVSTMPLHLYERSADNTRTRAIGHPLYSVLHRRANEHMSASHFREVMMRSALLHGNAYALINTSGSYTELWPIPANHVRVEYNEDTYAPEYYIRHGNNVEKLYPAFDIFHIRNSGERHFVGDSPITQCKNAILLALLLEEHGRLFFENMGRPSGFLTADSTLSEKQLDKLIEAWSNRTAGSNLYNTPIIPGADKYVSVAFSSVDNQFIETRKEQVVEIARVFGVPPHSLFELGRATWDNITAERQEFLDGSLSEWLTRWEDEVYMKLLSPDEQQRYFAEFLTDNFLRMNPLDRAEAQAKRIASRTLSPNEARAQENLPPYAGGDKFINPNTTTSPSPDNPNPDDAS